MSYYIDANMLWRLTKQLEVHISLLLMLLMFYCLVANISIFIIANCLKSATADIKLLKRRYFAFSSFISSPNFFC